MAALPGPILEKITTATPLLKSTYNMDQTLYDNVYVTSDIHCDLVKLDFLLGRGGLIGRPNPNPALPSVVDRILHMEWIPERTLFIIVGDVVDGSRTDDWYSVLSEIPDTKGNIELLLHAYLYNLRIKARLRNSEVRFTLGNHDYHSVIKMDSFDYPHFYSRWVHATARSYFVTRANRRACLMPFYECCFFLVAAVGTELGCIHGGFTVYNKRTKLFVDITETVLHIQERIEAAGYDGLTDDDHLFLSNIQSGRGQGHEGSPLWSRAYTLSADLCPQVVSHYKMVIVGHCQMAGAPYTCGSEEQHTGDILATAPYTKYRCGGPTGCVVLGCNDANGPHLAFVDIGFSRTFSTGGTSMIEMARRAEVLHMKHEPALESGARYYNVIVRKNMAAAGSDENVWSAKPRTGGKRSRKQKHKRRKTRKHRINKN